MAIIVGNLGTEWRKSRDIVKRGLIFFNLEGVCKLITIAFTLLIVLFNSIA